MTKQESLTAVESEVKLSLNPDESLLRQLPRYVRRAVNHILEFCNREDMSDTLVDIAHDMVVDTLKIDGKIKVEEKVKSISRGDTSISYVEDKKSDAFAKLMADYSARLVRHKKMKVPKTLEEDIYYD